MSDISPCDHEEVDTRLFLHVQHARSNAIIKTVDTDVVIIAIFCFKDLGIERLWIEFGCGSRTRFIPIHQVVSAMPHCDIIAPSLPQFHALAGSSVARGGGGGGGSSPPHWLVKYAKSHVFCDFEADFL